MLAYEQLIEILGDTFALIEPDTAATLQRLELSAPAYLLDVGTGEGNSAVYFAWRGHRVLTGEPETDDSIYAKQDWQSRAEQAGVAAAIEYRDFNAARMPFVDGTFDAVMFLGVLHHINANIRSQVLAESLRVCKAGGGVAFLEPNDKLLERVRRKDDKHPPAANPNDYAAELGKTFEFHAGQWLDSYLGRKA